MQGYLKELRYPVTGLVILLLVTLMVLVQRRELQRATERVETLLIADILLSLSPTNIQFHGAIAAAFPSDNNQGQSPSTAQQAVDQSLSVYDENERRFGDFGAIEVLGQVSAKYEDACLSQLRFPSVG